MEFERVILPIRREVSKVATVDRDPEVKYLPDGQAVANFSTANPPGRKMTKGSRGCSQAAMRKRCKPWSGRRTASVRYLTCVGGGFFISRCSGQVVQC